MRPKYKRIGTPPESPDDVSPHRPDTYRARQPGDPEPVKSDLSGFTGLFTFCGCHCGLDSGQLNGTMAECRTELERRGWTYVKYPPAPVQCNADGVPYAFQFSSVEGEWFAPGHSKDRVPTAEEKSCYAKKQRAWMDWFTQ
jgi:hypothetical protein